MKHIGTFAIWYDTAVPGWVAVSDKEQKTFGTGAKGEREATRYALREAFPEVATAVVSFPTYVRNGMGFQHKSRIRSYQFLSSNKGLLRQTVWGKSV